MRRWVTMFLIVGLVGMGWPRALVAESAAAASSVPATVLGTVGWVDGTPAVQHTVRARSLAAGDLVGVTRTDAQGAFAFRDLRPGTYTFEVFDQREAFVGTSASVDVEPGAIVGGVPILLAQTRAQQPVPPLPATYQPSTSRRGGMASLLLGMAVGAGVTTAVIALTDAFQDEDGNGTGTTTRSSSGTDTSVSSAACGPCVTVDCASCPNGTPTTRDVASPSQ